MVSLVLAGAIYTLLEPYKVLGFHVPHNLENPTIWFILLISAVSLFGFLVLFTFLGCCGAACKNRQVYDFNFEILGIAVPSIHPPILHFTYTALTLSCSSILFVSSEVKNKPVFISLWLMIP